MQDIRELLLENKILPRSISPGRYYMVCPRCSHQRSIHNRKKKVLGLTITPEKVYWGCNHCGWTGPEKRS
jgi:hypothetical protein